MAAHLSITGLLGIGVVCLGLAGPAHADHFLTHGTILAAQPVAAQAAEVPRQAARAGAQTPRLLSNKRVVVLPKTQDPAKGAAKGDASVYITPRYIPKDDVLLRPYSTVNAPKAKARGVSVPGLLGIALQTYRAQAPKARNGGGQKNYSLADAMRDAMWRKETAAKLKDLMQ